MRNTLKSVRLIQPFAAYSLTQQTFIFSGWGFHWFHPAAWLMFTGAFIAYNFFSAGLLCRILSATAFVFFLLMIHPSLYFILMVAALALLSMLYLKSCVSILSFRFSIRKIPYLKTTLLTVIWTLATVMIPFSGSVSLTEISRETAARFLFLFPVIIASDRIDFEKDKAAGVLSLPVLLGEKKSKWISAFFLFLYLVFMEFVYLPSVGHQQVVAAETLVLVSFIMTCSLCLTKLKNAALHRVLLDLSVSALFVLMLLQHAC